MRPVYSTEKLDQNNTALLVRWLCEIYDMGDQDEMSWKHLGHGIGALLSDHDWKSAEDYNHPDVDLTREQLMKLDACWACIWKIIKREGKQKVLNTLPDLAKKDNRFLYLNHYVQSELSPYRAILEDDGYYPIVER